MFERETLDDGCVRLSSRGCSFHFRRLRPGVLHVTVVGDDRGDFGMAALDEISAEITRFSSIDLFVDARATVGVDTQVTEAWTAWFEANRSRLRSVSLLTTGKFMTLAVSISKHLSKTGNLIAIHTDPAPFEEALTRIAPGPLKARA